ncbi:hypothetical protein PSDVSF_11190 [Pseudodesulfovibrio sediminis]|uniref:Uncharacterized protein n=1 Tax=Pseudodesulfovibrio sediminis TaxID=2810563 RepID=A0ABN6ER14_9BACT|nr:hypothetical protein PSDVSF_11190 [Pseudodesulfovibrio sediminis]
MNWRIFRMMYSTYATFNMKGPSCIHPCKQVQINTINTCSLKTYGAHSSDTASCAYEQRHRTDRSAEWEEKTWE